MAQLQYTNYYEKLTPKQKIEIEEKRGIILYYNFFDDCKEYLNFEQTGILTMALLFYGTTKGREPLPDELKKKIEADNLLCLLCGVWLGRIAEADKNWLSHKRYKKGQKLFAINDEVYNLVGVPDNMPNNTDELSINDEKDIIDFIMFGNKVEWVIPFDQLLVLWEKER